MTFLKYSKGTAQRLKHVWAVGFEQPISKDEFKGEVFIIYLN